MGGSHQVKVNLCIKVIMISLVLLPCKTSNPIPDRATLGRARPKCRVHAVFGPLDGCFSTRRSQMPSFGLECDLALISKPQTLKPRIGLRDFFRCCTVQGASKAFVIAQEKTEPLSLCLPGRNPARELTVNLQRYDVHQLKVPQHL